MEIKVGKKYRLLNTIGQGGFGDVYKAEDSSTGKVVAVKLERRSTSDMIFGESKILTSLKGTAGIPEVFEAGLEGDFNFMAMEFCGLSLASLLAQIGSKFSLKVDSRKPDCLPNSY